ncbi:PREDICTED: uncharacterized protein LOC106332910 [Brassica oleracea var. oleracea]|uniref:uncharacterized protein LOC106332910 n=1 Tax=Brassica oleracea var. oleracea TaxID=109376 RepID=UPI0006A6BE5A|nr:PREDICTED: uncharacterized protein LOC106332910 [Brassica oleracea var. oleracea]
MEDSNFVEGTPVERRKRRHWTPKWCELNTCKADGSAKRRKLDDGANSSTSHASDNNTGGADQAATRPLGVKASKGHGKQKTKAEAKSASEFHSMWSIKKEDMAMKERLSKMKLLDSLIAKPEPLHEYEEALKKKLIYDLLS